MIRIVGSKENVDFGNFNGFVKKESFLNNFYYLHGKSIYAVDRFTVYDDETGETIGNFRWITTKHGSNNLSNGIEVVGKEIKKTTEKRIDDYKKKKEIFIASLGRTMAHNELKCEVFIPRSELQGDIINEDDMGYDGDVYLNTYYVENRYKVLIKSVYVRDGFDYDSFKENLYKMIMNNNDKLKLKRIEKILKE